MYVLFLFFLTLFVYFFRINEHKSKYLNISYVYKIDIDIQKSIPIYPQINLLSLNVFEQQTSITKMKIELFERLTIKQIATYWFSNVAIFSALYYGLSILIGTLLYNGEPLKTSLTGFGNALYFSFTTAMTLSNSNIVPVGIGKVFVVLESLTSIGLIGLLIGKIVSERQEQIIEEINEITIEELSHNIISELYLFRNQSKELIEKIQNQKNYQKSKNKKKNIEETQLFSKELSEVQITINEILKRFNVLIEKLKISNPQESMMHLSLMINSINYSLSRFVELLEEFNNEKIDRNKESTTAIISEAVKIQTVLSTYIKRIQSDEQTKLIIEEKLKDLDKVVTELQKST